MGVNVIVDRKASIRGYLRLTHTRPEYSYRGIGNMPILVERTIVDDRSFPPPPSSMLRYRVIGLVRRPDFVRGEGGGGGIISSFYMISSV